MTHMIYMVYMILIVICSRCAMFPIFSQALPSVGGDCVVCVSASVACIPGKKIFTKRNNKKQPGISPRPSTPRARARPHLLLSTFHPATKIDNLRMYE